MNKIVRNWHYSSMSVNMVYQFLRKDKTSCTVPSQTVQRPWMPPVNHLKMTATQIKSVYSLLFLYQCGVTVQRNIFAIFCFRDFGHVAEKRHANKPFYFYSQVRSMCAVLWDAVATTALTTLSWSYRWGFTHLCMHSKLCIGSMHLPANTFIQ